MTNELGGSLTERVAEHLAVASIDAIPEGTRVRARQRLLDSVGNLAAGRRASGNEAVLHLLRRWGGAGEAHLLTTRERVPAPQAAFANALLMRSFDFEAVGADTFGGAQIASHITGTTVSVALAAAEAFGSSGAELLTALVYGDDLAARLGHATGFDVYGGLDNTGTINAFGGVAVAGILAGLDPRQFRDALGLVCNQLGGTIANVFDQVDAFKLPIALSARNAIFSVELAKAGFSGAVDALGGRFGYLRQYGGEDDARKVTDALGAAFFADATIKPWPSCRASHPTLDGVLRLVHEHGLHADDVRAVRLHVTPRTKAGFVGAPFTVGESPEVSAAFSIVFTAAAALVAGELTLRQINEPFMRSPEVTAMMARIELIDSLPAHESLTAEVEIDTEDGRVLRSRVDVPLGDLHFNPLPEDAVIAKYRSNMRFAGYDDAAGEAVRVVLDEIEHHPHPAAEIAALLAC